MYDEVRAEQERDAEDRRYRQNMAFNPVLPGSSMYEGATPWRTLALFVVVPVSIFLVAMQIRASIGDDPVPVPNPRLEQMPTIVPTVPPTPSSSVEG